MCRQDSGIVLKTKIFDKERSTENRRLFEEKTKENRKKILKKMAKECFINCDLCELSFLAILNMLND